MKKNATCANCRFVDQQQKITPNGEPIVGEFQLICRYGPPTPAMVPIPQPEGLQMQTITQFPPVTENMWCHRWVTKEKVGVEKYVIDPPAA